MGKYLTTHIPIALAYGLVIAAINGNWWPFATAEVWRWVLFVLGVVIGHLLLFLDRVAYTYAYPLEQLSQHFAYLVSKKQYAQAMTLLYERRREQERLTFRSALFMVIWIPLAFFALTSTTAIFGKGVVLGLMFHILYDAWRLQRIEPLRLNKRLFWQVKREFRHEEQLIFLFLVTGVFLWFSFWVR